MDLASARMRKASDPELIAQARGGNRDAFGELVRRHEKKALAVAIGVLRNREDARDLCQEAFLKVHRNLAQFDGAAQFSTWLYRIVVNVCIDHLRRRRFDAVPFEEGVAVDADLLGYDVDPLRALANKRLGKRISAALDALSMAHRTVLVLRELQGLSYQEIADAMHCSIGTVMSRLFHARKKMQSLLSDIAAPAPLRLAA